MNNILVTGGAGFIGSNLIPRLLEKGHSVIVFDNLSSGKLENLKDVSSNSRFRFFHGDIRNVSELHDALAGVDAVVHLAALIDVSASVVNPFFTHDVNVSGTLNVLQEAQKCKVEKFVFASSTAVYGDVKSLPVTEDTPLRPISPYAASKAAGEAYCSAFAGCCGLDTVMLRFFNVYGPRNEGSPYSGVIPKFLRQALDNRALTIDGDGTQTRDFIHVTDVARALVLALDSERMHGAVFNICTGTPTRINDLVQYFAASTGRNLDKQHHPVRIGDIKFSYGDPSKAQKKLGFKASISMQEGLKMLVDSFGH